MTKLYRDMKLCIGVVDCGASGGNCLGEFPDLLNGPMLVGNWVFHNEHNRRKIKRVMNACRSGAIKIKKIRYQYL